MPHESENREDCILWCNPDIPPADLWQSAALLSVAVSWHTGTSQCQDKPRLAVAMMYEVLSNGFNRGRWQPYIGGPVISAVECVRGWLGLDGAVEGRVGGRGYSTASGKIWETATSWTFGKKKKKKDDGTTSEVSEYQKITKKAGCGREVKQVAGACC